MDKYVNRDYPKMDCIGMIPPLDLLQTVGFSICMDSEGRGSIPEFDGKTIVDFGAGVSDFANTISQLSQPERIAVVDIMYQDKDFYDGYVEKTRGFISEKVRDLHTAVRNDANKIDNGDYSELERLYQHVGNRLKRQVRILAETSHHKPSIEKCTSINELRSVGKWDYVFATHVLYSMSDRLYGLALISMMLKEGGRIFVTDYDRVGVMGECTKILRQEIQHGNKGIHEIEGTHGDAYFEITQMGAVEAYKREQGMI